VPHSRHFPRSSSHDTMGTLSRAATGWSHSGQRERGATTDSFRGTRWITTLRNEPTASPSTPQATASSAITVRRLPAGSHPAVSR
jgi:hypothetical protein